MDDETKFKKTSRESEIEKYITGRYRAGTRQASGAT